MPEISERFKHLCRNYCWNPCIYSVSLKESPGNIIKERDNFSIIMQVLDDYIRVDRQMQEFSKTAASLRIQKGFQPNNIDTNGVSISTVIPGDPVYLPFALSN